MHAEYLAKMANQIGDFFGPEQGPEGAPLAIARHMRRFWDPRMRQQILAHLGAGGDGLSPAARRAVELLADQPAAATGR